MTSTKKFALVAITLATGITAFVVTKRFNAAVPGDDPHKTQSITPTPNKKPVEIPKQEAKVEKPVETRRENTTKRENTPKRKQPVTDTSQSITSIRKVELTSQQTEPALNESNQNENLVITENNKTVENAIVNTELPRDKDALEKPAGKYFKFEVLSIDGTALPTLVHSVDLQKGRELASYKTNSYIDIPPNRKSMTLVCGVFGYKQVEKVVDYNNPSRTEGAYEDQSGAWVIPYTLEPLAPGDVSVMYNVAFYKDAVVMLPQSKGELSQLLDMLRDHDYTIKIHGHCNGKYDRKIIALGETKNYFDVNGSQEIYGSAKHLSALRAEAIRSYLVDNGINPERVKTQAWGASDQLVDENSPNAKINDRVEIEILGNGR